MGRLTYGRDLDESAMRKILESSDGTSASKALVAIVKDGEERAKISFVAASSLKLAGLLESDPRRKASAAAADQLKHLPAVAFCARLAPSPSSAPCRKTLSTAIKAWVTTNTPAGNPIDDASLVPLIQAIDLASALMSPEERATATQWLREVIRRGDGYYASGERAGKPREFKNYLSWHLGVRALTAVVLDDPDLKHQTSRAFAEQVAHNILDDGSTRDFRDRDALHYHLYDMQPLMLTALFAPEIVSKQAHSRICHAVAFIKPFYTGEQVHTEFQNSTSSFDKARRDAGEKSYALVPWSPSKAETFVRRGRLLCPEVRSWTENLPADSGSVLDRLLVALH